MRADSTHCDHGTYIGYPGGADYLCQWCEDGISVSEVREIYRVREDNRVRSEAFTLNALYDAIHDCDATEADKRKSWQHIVVTYTER